LADVTLEGVLVILSFCPCPASALSQPLYSAPMHMHAGTTHVIQKQHRKSAKRVYAVDIFAFID
jgi:hypothetical protein